MSSQCWLLRQLHLQRRADQLEGKVASEGASRSDNTGSNKQQARWPRPQGGGDAATPPLLTTNITRDWATTPASCQAGAQVHDRKHHTLW